MLNNQLSLSVCLITYNQVRYIRQAIESVLMQCANFEWELIIADDCSTDGTSQIIEEYFKTNPQLIRVIKREVNVGPGKNFVELINSARGKYIAYLEGDDYWTDEKKVQKQFNFLESNLNFSVCYHKVKWKFTYKSNELDSKESNIDDPSVSSISDVLIKGWFIRSCSLFFKNIALPIDFDKLYIGDYPLVVLLADRGKIGFMNEVMAIYRINDEGKSEKYLLTETVERRAEIFRNEIEVLSYLDKHTSFKYTSTFNRKILFLVRGYLSAIIKKDIFHFAKESKYIISKTNLFSVLWNSYFVKDFKIR